MRAMEDPMSSAATAPQPFAYRQRTVALDDREGQVRAMDEDGFVLVPGALSPDEVAATRAALDRLQHFGLDAKWNNGGKWHFKCVFNRERLWLNRSDQAGIIELAEKLMGDQCHLIGMSAWKTFPGGDQPYLHVDKLWAPYLPESVWEDPRFRLPPHICTAHYYLQDQTPDLCPTYVIPGSHRAGRGPANGETTWKGRAAEPVLCRAGDCLFFRSEVWHGGSANTSDRVRYLLQVHYAHRDVAQKFSPWPFHLNPEILAVATPRQRRLLGEHPESAYG
jgi:ectoine hydroxylase-related dioxygenase (phytanoyl-CoA dioxygenase family)